MFLPKEASFKEAYISRISLKAKIWTLSIGYQTLFQSDLLLLPPRLTESSWTGSSSGDTEPSLSDKQSCSLWACAVKVLFYFQTLCLLICWHETDNHDHGPLQGLEGRWPSTSLQHPLWGTRSHRQTYSMEKQRALLWCPSVTQGTSQSYGSHGFAASAGLLLPCGYFE